VAWFPKVILYIYYSVTTLENATHFGIFSKEDHSFEVVKKEVIDLPPIDYDSELSVVKKFNLNIEHGATQIIVFEYKIFHYIYCPSKDNFEAISYQIKAAQSMIVENYSAGLNPNEVLYMNKIFGICDIDIKINSCGKILFDELTDPFYLFQLYSVILWYCTEYYYYASVIVVLAILSLVLSVYGTYKNLKKIQEISRYSCPVRVYRKNENNEFMDPVEINSTELVPGDMIEIPEDGLALPCDTILISGSVIVNESMLTGESTPVIKVRMTSNEDI
jgi:magnesium-transporting ATPase (P-type)